MGDIMKVLFKILRKVIISSFLLYIYNFFAINFNMIIPINIITVLIVSFFDLFGLLGMIFFKYFIL